jgi:16S rRNA A1518/A1519 N6-dimethyltransferase RsmA/KsgA/DIM1 with predicted DNA glycosylase/AP lyase activity
VPETNFDEWIAQRMDVLWPEVFEPALLDRAVDFLADLAGAGPVLEFAVGTGRIALPLSSRGVRVHGIELSTAMVDQLRSRAGADEVGVTVGDFATAKVDEKFNPGARNRRAQGPCSDPHGPV